MSADIVVVNHGTLFTFAPKNEAAAAWLRENVQPDAEWWAGTLVVEHRYARDLADGIVEAGLVLA